MIESTQELAENKLLVLYVFKRVNCKLSDEQITNIILENNLLNYFLLKQYISELIESNFIECSKESGINFYSITKKGISILELFQTRIQPSIITTIDKFVSNKFKTLKSKTEIVSNYTPKSNNEYIATCKIFENTSVIFELSINVATKSQARTICSNWEKNAQKIYQEIIYSLTDDR